MESLAVVIAVLFLIAIFAGPIGIALTAKFLTNAIDVRLGSGFRVVDFLRQGVILILVCLGVLIGSQFLFVSGLPIFPRLVGVFAIVTSYIALRREFFPTKFITRGVLGKIGFGKHGRGSSGSDGHGPSGQH